MGLQKKGAGWLENCCHYDSIGQNLFDVYQKDNCFSRCTYFFVEFLL